MDVPPCGRSAVQDHLALAEIELCSELMIAASAVAEGRLSPDRIDEVLDVTSAPTPSAARRAAPAQGGRADRSGTP
ncbi:hypothetical protein [Streptomyces meridianus]|uniref:ANTAR domain-containing protein n=1 Tax=Streptomyces meridianus TaxID=2938945 RepID=A0ABT0X513_9ACTN|nr:hypothetical protein [Streptomyces meridianus]MCM2577340.1 hypothetical protein [Streptomyces meridianus]